MTCAGDPGESAATYETATPLRLIAGLCFAAWPTWVGVLPPFSPRLESKPVTAATRPADAPAFLLELTDEELLKRLEADPASLGSLSIGAPGSAIVFNALPMPSGPHWEPARGAGTWGTSETLASVQTAIETVNELYPDTPPMVVGDISDRDG